MRPHWVLLPLLSGLIGNVAAQADENDPVISIDDPVPSETASDSTTDAPPTTTDAPPPTTTGGGSESDTTTTVTRTVSGDGGGVTTSFTTTTTVSVIIIAVTESETTTVTSRGDATATSTIYHTSTTVVNLKRGIEFAEAERTAPVAQAEAAPTVDAPAPTATSDDLDIIELMRGRAVAAADLAERADLAKRATITVTATVTEDGDASTVVSTRTATRRTTSSSTTTRVITETEQADATTTVTVTSTIVETSTHVSTGVTEPTSDPGEGNGDGNNNSEEDNGLSTGAKAGIGAAAGVAGLAIIGALVWLCLRRRRDSVKPDHDDMIGASEVPVGAAAAGAAGRRTPSMSHTPSSGGGYAAVPPSNLTAEGYRGTAMGDGRAGYAKPEPYGAAYTRMSANKSVSPATGYSRPTERSSTLRSADQLPEHSTPSEMDSAAASEGRHGSPAAELGAGGTSARWQNPDAAEMDGTSAVPPVNQQNGPVYEMPAHDYR